MPYRHEFLLGDLTTKQRVPPKPLSTVSAPLSSNVSISVPWMTAQNEKSSSNGLFSSSEHTPYWRFFPRWYFSRVAISLTADARRWDFGSNSKKKIFYGYFFKSVRAPIFGRWVIPFFMQSVDSLSSFYLSTSRILRMINIRLHFIMWFIESA